MQIFPATLRNLWTIWELPPMVLLSLLLQIVLILMGYKRKYTSNILLQWLLWLAYLSADWVATVSLGILSSDDGGSDDSSKPSRYVIRALWAPFLLLHLGGPDTITAYSMQDNDLWPRHLLGLLVQVGIASYVFLRALQPTALNFVAIPVFVAGIIKYGERTWVLMTSSSQYLRDSLLPHVHGFILSLFPGPPHYTHFVDGLSKPTIGRVDENGPIQCSKLQRLSIAHSFFQTNKRLFADVPVSSNDLEKSVQYFTKVDSKIAFKVIELELGFMYDFFYTKSSVIYSRWGVFLRFTSLSSIVIAIATFFVSEFHKYPLADVYLTFILLFGALGLEIYSILLLLSSDWGLTQFNNSVANWVLRVLSHCGWSLEKKRWSNSIPQHNLITILEDEDKIDGISCKLLLKQSSCINKMMAASVPISDWIKERILKQLKLKRENADDKPCWILRERCRSNLLQWSLDFDLSNSIVLWHLVTHICYHFDHKTEFSNSAIILEDSKSLSNFLTYLLAYHHSLFPNGIGNMTTQFSVNTIRILLGRHEVEKIVQLYERMTSSETVERVHGDEGEEKEEKTIFCAFQLAKALIDTVEVDERWEIISNMWVEMLINVSGECKWYEHTQQLAQGGDLLTHVWLLMHHLNYIKQVYHIANSSNKGVLK